jgi:hypothetical protein
VNEASEDPSQLSGFRSGETEEFQASTCTETVRELVDRSVSSGVCDTDEEAVIAIVKYRSGYQLDDPELESLIRIHGSLPD